MFEAYTTKVEVSTTKLLPVRVVPVIVPKETFHAVPENTSEELVASGINVNTDALSS